MGAALTARERYDLALGQLAPALGCAQARATFENDYELLLGEMVVIWVGGFTGRQFPQAQSEALAAGLAAKPCALAAKPGMLARLIEEGIVVQHRAAIAYLGEQTMLSWSTDTSIPHNARPSTRISHGRST